MNSQTSPPASRPVTPFEYLVFFTLVLIVAVLFLRFEASDIHNTFSNLVAAWNQS